MRFLKYSIFAFIMLTAQARADEPPFNAENLNEDSWLVWVVGGAISIFAILLLAALLHWIARKISGKKPE